MRGKVAEKRERCTNVMSAKSYSARGIGAHTIFGSSILTRRPMKLNADIAKRNTVQIPFYINRMARCLKRVGTTSLDYRYLAGLGTTRMHFWAGNLFRRTGDLKFLRHCSQFDHVLHQNM